MLGGHPGFYFMCFSGTPQAPPGSLSALIAGISNMRKLTSVPIVSSFRRHDKPSCHGSRLLRRMSTCLFVYLLERHSFLPARRRNYVLYYHPRYLRCVRCRIGSILSTRVCCVKKHTAFHQGQKSPAITHAYTQPLVRANLRTTSGHPSPHHGLNSVPPKHNNNTAT